MPYMIVAYLSDTQTQLNILNKNDRNFIYINSYACEVRVYILFFFNITHAYAESLDLTIYSS